MSETKKSFPNIAFKQLADGSFGVSVKKGTTASPGDLVKVEKKDGSVKEVVLGEFVESNTWGDTVYRVKQTGK